MTQTDVGRANLEGEFTSMSAIREVGTYVSNSDVHFYLCSFVRMTGKVGEVETLPAKLAEMHLNGVAKNGKFGFSMPTYRGALQQPNSWKDTWEEFFSDMMQRCFNWEQEVHGHGAEMTTLFQAIIERVIPRLLRPLEAGEGQLNLVSCTETCGTEIPRQTLGLITL